jgi:hypothetical protein
MSQSKVRSDGFRSMADGGAGARYGRDVATGRAFKADGTVRAERKVLSPLEALQKAQQDAQAARASVGRKVLAEVPGAEAVVAKVATLRRYVRECKAYATPEAREAKAAYYQRMADAIENKGVAAAAYLPKVAGAMEAVGDLHAKVGNAIESAMAKGGNVEKAVQDVLGTVLTPEVRAILDAASDPDADPFAAFRVGAPENEDAQD